MAFKMIQSIYSCQLPSSLNMDLLSKWFFFPCQLSHLAAVAPTQYALNRHTKANINQSLASWANCLLPPSLDQGQ